MGHPAVDNATPFAFEMLFVSDEEGRPLLVPIAKATYDLGSSGEVRLAEEQAPPSFTGECWGTPGESSYKFEPETAFVKVATDLVLIGHAHALKGTNEVDVTLRVGTIEKTVRVFGDRYWKSGLGGVSMTRPEPFDRMPLVYERAFGGWDRSTPDATKHGYEPRNPVGVGYHAKHGKLGDRERLPNLEDPKHLIRKPHDTPPPAGFGFVSPDWKPRRDHAGTYDDSWLRSRAPLLPVDFDRRFFNAAHPDLTVPQRLTGGEPVLVTNVTRESRLGFVLPRVRPLTCQVDARGVPGDPVELQLDTVVVDADDRRLLLVWRSHVALPTGPNDVNAITLAGGES